MDDTTRNHMLITMVIIILIITFLIVIFYTTGKNMEVILWVLFTVSFIIFLYLFYQSCKSKKNSLVLSSVDIATNLTELNSDSDSDPNPELLRQLADANQPSAATGGQKDSRSRAQSTVDRARKRRNPNQTTSFQVGSTRAGLTEDDLQGHASNDSSSGTSNL